MKAKPLPSSKDLVSLLDYDQASGRMVWRPRVDGFYCAVGYSERWNKKYAGREAGKIKPSGYVVIKIANSEYAAHRIAFGLMGAEIPDFVDHKNGVRSDNSFSNLRRSSREKNNLNRRIPKNNKTGICGVMIGRGGKFIVQIQRKGFPRVRKEFACKCAAAKFAAKTYERMGFDPNHGDRLLSEARHG
jgi:hypothetical protein